MQNHPCFCMSKARQAPNRSPGMLNHHQGTPNNDPHATPKSCWGHLQSAFGGARPWLVCNEMMMMMMVRYLTRIVGNILKSASWGSLDRNHWIIAPVSELPNVPWSKWRPHCGSETLWATNGTWRACLLLAHIVVGWLQKKQPDVRYKTIIGWTKTFCQYPWMSLNVQDWWKLLFDYYASKFMYDVSSIEACPLMTLSLPLNMLTEHR